ncbi:MAG: NAD(P)/FAD-dependent oxidoreductase [Planctomycetota bacterium]
MTITREGDGSGRVAVVGAGVAGLAAARALAEQGVEVVVFDKGRGPGGRTARRRRDGHHFDHGAQHVTARDPRFADLLASAHAAGDVAEWDARLVTIGSGGARRPAPSARRVVGVPGMSGLARHLGTGLDVRFGRRATGLRRAKGRWALRFDDGDEVGPFDGVVVAAPAPQSAALLAPVCPRLAGEAAGARMRPCWAVMLAFDGRLPVDFDGALVETGGPLRWIARDASKPGRPPGETWVLHADHAWSDEHLEAPPDDVADALAAAFFETAAIAPVASRLRMAHRWRYALVERAVGAPCLFDAAARVAACGDWCTGTRVEDAYVSGLAAAAASQRFMRSPISGM